MKTTEQCPRGHIFALSILAIVLSLAAVASATERQSLLTAQTFSGLKLRNIGPAQWSGRISDIVKDPTKTSTWYVAVASGNVWKTVNNGTTWTPIFDNYGSYSTQPPRDRCGPRAEIAASTRPPTVERTGNSSSLLAKTQASAILPLIRGIRT